MDDSKRFEVLPAGEMRRKYGLTAEAAARITLDRDRIPESVWPLIPYAETWGISDDLIRADFAKGAGNAALDELRAAIQPFDDELDLWLAGPEADQSPMTREYLAFTCMRMAADGV